MARNKWETTSVKSPTEGLPGYAVSGLTTHHPDGSRTIVPPSGKPVTFDAERIEQ